MTTPAHLLHRPEGRIAYDLRGPGGAPLVVCVPGMGDVRQGYDVLADALADAGFRVATMDLRGHGESDTTFQDHSRPAAGDDVLALIEHLADGQDIPVHLVGCSYGASAVVWAASRQPARIAGLTLIGPFVRNVPVPWYQQVALRVLLARPWGSWAWGAWFRALHKTVPPGLDGRVAAVRRSMADPARLAALRAMARTDCARIDPLLDGLTVPVSVVMGAADPDFPDPAAEAAEIARRAGGTVQMVPGAGHYPHIERATEVVPGISAHVRASIQGAAAAEEAQPCHRAD